MTLPCNHAYCARCVAALRERHVQQVCPLCREPLAQGGGGGEDRNGGGGLGDDLYDEATRLFVPVQRAVERGQRGRAPGGWGRLPPALQADVDRCVGVGSCICLRIFGAQRGLAVEIAVSQDEVILEIEMFPCCFWSQFLTSGLC